MEEGKGGKGETNRKLRREKNLPAKWRIWGCVLMADEEVWGRVSVFEMNHSFVQEES